jgi:RNA polymerase subunit RPABC4/transcription elongation factor Spt4
MAIALPQGKGSQLAKKISGFVFIFIGLFFCLIGFLFSFLFEVYGLLALAGVGIMFIVIAIILLAKSKDVSMLEMGNYRSLHNLRIGIQNNFQKQCEACARMIPMDALLCPYCGRKIEHSIESRTTIPKQETNCPSCGSKTEPAVKYCSYCGTELK